MITKGYVFNPPKPCRICGETITPARALLEKTTCLDCQVDLDKTEPVKHTVAIPYNKGAYQHIYNPADLFGTNPKRTI
jgi:hypothetical protein